MTIIVTRYTLETIGITVNLEVITHVSRRRRDKKFHRNIICELSLNIVSWDMELNGLFALDVITRDVYIDQMGQPEVYLYILAWS